MLCLKVRHLKKKLWYGVCFGFVLLVNPQSYSTSSKKAISYFEKAIQKYRSGDDREALILLTRALSYDSLFYEAIGVIADIYYENKKYDSAALFYEKFMNSGMVSDPQKYRYANSMFLSGNYGKCFNFITHSHLSQKDFVDKMVFLRECCRLADSMIKNPLPVKIYNCGDSINSEYDEYFPSISLDERMIIFTRRIQYQGRPNEDFYFTIKVGENAWQKAKNMGPPVNTIFNEGAQSYAPDGSFLLFVRCNFPEGFGSCDIWRSNKTSSGWGTPYLLPKPLNSGSWESQPSVAPDNATIYFVSNRPGGKGGSDIWKVIYDEENKYISTPVCLPINTAGNEMTPYVHPDNQTLYFSSDGYPGMGGLDIFVVKFNGDSFGIPQNMGYPINTNGDDNSFVVFPTGELAIMSSNRGDTRGGLDLYFVELPESVRPNPIVILTGNVVSSGGKPLSALIQVIDISSGKVLSSGKSDAQSGYFRISAPAGKEAVLTAEAEGFLPYLKEIFLSGQSTIIKRDIRMEPIVAGQSIRLQHVYFDFNSYELLPSSKAELDKWVSILKKNPSIHISVEGHTDNIGSREYNMYLSRMRALAVRNYFIEHGIDSTRIQYVGYGDTKPLAPNDTEENRALNRRTEIKIIKGP